MQAVNRSLHEKCGFGYADRMPTLTPALCRAARALLDLTQDQLAVLAGLGTRTIKAFELGNPPVSAESVSTIGAALAARGIELVSETDGTVGVLLKPGDGCQMEGDS